MWSFIFLIALLIVTIGIIPFPELLGERRIRRESTNAYITYKLQEKLAMEWWLKEVDQLHKRIEDNENRHPVTVIKDLYYYTPEDVERIKILRKYLKSEGFKVRRVRSFMGNKDEFSITWK